MQGNTFLSFPLCHFFLPSSCLLPFLLPSSLLTPHFPTYSFCLSHTQTTTQNHELRRGGKGGMVGLSILFFTFPFSHSSLCHPIPSSLSPSFYLKFAQCVTFLLHLPDNMVKNSKKRKYTTKKDKDIQFSYFFASLHLPPTFPLLPPLPLSLICF